ncbi:MAG: DNA polymerase [Thermodesulfobacteriota bacterium]
MQSLNNEDCEKCGLCKLRTHVVNGRGDDQAKIMLVSEWPGSPEDKTGDIDSGPIRIAVNRLLRKAGISPVSVFLTTVVRCIPKAPPPDYVRDPSKEEIEACSAYLDKEIEALKPTVIVPMGNVALKRVLGQRTAMIGKFRGTEVWSDKYNCKVMPIMHPMYVRRRLQYEGITVNDLRRVKTSSQTTKLTEKRLGVYKVADTFEKAEKLIDKLRTVPEFVFDLETSGLNGRKDTVMCIAFTWKEGLGFTLPIHSYRGEEETYTEIKLKSVRKKDKQTKAWIKTKKEVPVEKTRTIHHYLPYWGEKQRIIIDKLRALFASDIPKIAHNGKFDSRFLMESYKMQVNKLTFDTMLAHYMLDENAPSHKLKDLAWVVDMGGYDDPLEQWFKDNKIAVGDRNYAMLPPDMLYEYGAKDADNTMRQKNLYEPQLKGDAKLWLLFKQVIMILSETLMEAEVHGMKIDRDYISELKKSFEGELAGINIKIDQIAPGLNIKSTPQLRELLFTKWKLPVVKKTKKGLASTDESVLEDLKTQHPLIPLILQHRKAYKMYGTYVMGINDLIDENGRIHTEFLIHGTVTGRLSSKNPNVQNIPRRDTRIKPLFIAEEGFFLIEADYAQAEFRHWANYSQDPVMIQDIIKATNGTGPDIHKLMASLALNIDVKDVDKEQRNQAKTIVFGLMFGRGTKSIADMLGCSEEHAVHVREIFFSRYPKASAWLKAAIREVQIRKEISSVFGRIRRLPTIDSPDKGLKALAERQAMNSPIQSAASDMNCNAANRIRLRFKREGLTGKICSLVHDSIILEVPKVEHTKSLDIVREEMERPIKGVTVPMVAELQTGVRWGKLELVEKVAA